MTNSAKLRKVIKNRGMKYGFLAESLGLSGYGLQRKIDGKSEFKAKEIEKLSELLQLTLEHKEEIFFAKDVDKTSTQPATA